MPWPCGSSPLKPPTTLRSNLLSEPTFSRRDLSSSGTEHHDSRDARGELCECSRMFLLGETSDHRHYFELIEVRRGPQTSVRDFLEQRAPRPRLQQSPIEAPGSRPSAPSTRPQVPSRNPVMRGHCAQLPLFAASDACTAIKLFSASARSPYFLLPRMWRTSSCPPPPCREPCCPAPTGPQETA